MVSEKVNRRTNPSMLRRTLHAYSERITYWLQDGKAKNAIPVLDGVRGCACFLVLLLHINTIGYVPKLWVPPREGIIGPFLNALAMPIGTGIVLFFTLSGFLLFLPFARALLFEGEWPSLRRFYLRRIFRIVPGYFVALFLMTLFIEPSYLMPDKWQDFRLFWVFLMDFPETSQKINAPFWTLAIEFQFYMLLPLIAWGLKLLLGKGSPRFRFVKLSLLLLSLMLGGFLVRYWGDKLADTSPLMPQALANFIKPLLYGQEGKFHEVFAIGMLVSTAYVYMQKVPPAPHIRRALTRCSPLIFLAGLVILVFMTLTHFYRYWGGSTMKFLAADVYTPLIVDWKLWYPLCHGLGCGLCLFALLYGTAWLKRPFEWTPLRWFGSISFSFYMWHYPFIFVYIILYAGKFRDLNWNPTAQYVVYWFFMLITAIPLATVLYRVIEIPGIRLGEQLCQRLAERRKTPPAQGVEAPVPVGVGVGGEKSARL